MRDTVYVVTTISESGYSTPIRAFESATKAFEYRARLEESISDEDGMVAYTVHSVYLVREAVE